MVILKGRSMGNQSSAVGHPTGSTSTYTNSTNNNIAVGTPSRLHVHTSSSSSLAPASPSLPHPHQPPYQVEPFVSSVVEAMVADVPIASIKKHLKSGKPAKEFMFLENEDLDMIEDTTEAQKMYNREKNRYTNILPCDTTRVKLSLLDGVEGSDYINANFIDGEICNSERAYIATQGPLMHTRSDFWRMVWETNSLVIVMLGKEKENDRVKVDRYWPEAPDGALTFGPLMVRASAEEEDGGRTIMIRLFELIHLPTGELRKITHYQYEGWPDHGVPADAAGIRHLVQLIEGHTFKSCYCSNGTLKGHRKSNSNGNHLETSPTAVTSPLAQSPPSPPAAATNGTISPLVVHCSAGVGRTGTFCTIHIALTRLHHDLHQGITAPKCNLYKTVLKLRRQRPGMVQQQEQYVFCYEAISEEAYHLGLVNDDQTTTTITTTTTTTTTTTSSNSAPPSPMTESPNMNGRLFNKGYCTPN